MLAGTLHTQPRPAPPHAFASLSLGDELVSPFQKSRGGPGGWVIIGEPELHLGDDILVPDLGSWRRETMPELPATPYFAVAPDWVCETLSPSTRRIDRAEKMGIYAREGISHLWLVDPDARTLEAFELVGGRWMLLATLAGDSPVSLPPFDAVTFPLGALWPFSLPADG